MTTLPPTQPHPIWLHYIAPTARACECFFWRLTFVSVAVCVFTQYNPLKPSATKQDHPVAGKGSGDPSRLAVADSAR